MRTFHKVFYFCLRLPVSICVRLFKRYSCKTYRPKAENYLVLSNHNTDTDFFLVAAMLPRQMYFVASEHIFRQGFISKVIKFLVDPIPRRKGASADETVALINERLQSGANVCMFAEGNRSFFGETGWISPNTATLVKKSGVALITTALHGGYFVNPRWGKTTRRGPQWGEVVHEYSPETLAAMTEDEILAAIRGDLYVSAYGDQKIKAVPYRCKAPAESLETALFVCPVCHEISTLHSVGDTVTCSHCGMHVRLDEYGMLSGCDGTTAPFSTILAWSRWQQDFLTAQLPQKKAEGACLFHDDDMRLSLVHPGRGVERLLCGRLSMFGDRLEISDGKETRSFALSDISKLSIVRRDSILFTAPDGYFEIKSDVPYSALKYLMCWRLLLGKIYVG